MSRKAVRFLFFTARKRSFLIVLLSVYIAQSIIANLSVSAEYTDTVSPALNVTIRNASPDVYYENVVLSLKGNPEDIYVERIGTGETVVKMIAVNKRAGSFYSDLRYTYCERATCFYREEEILIRPSIVPKWVHYLLEILLFGILAVIVIVLWKKVKTGFIVAMIIASVFAWLGVRNWQTETVRSIASTLCISCIGMETVPKAFSVSDAYTEAFWIYPIVTIEVFHTEWCKSCPIVIDFLKELAMFTGNIELSVFDAEKDEAIARERGIYSGNTLVVPTTIVEGKYRITGAERFPERLIEVVKEAMK